MLESLMKEDQLVSIPRSKPSAGGADSSAPAAAVVAAAVHPVTLSVEEKLTCQVGAYYASRFLLRTGRFFLSVALVLFAAFFENHFCCFVCVFL